MPFYFFEQILTFRPSQTLNYTLCIPLAYRLQQDYIHTLTHTYTHMLAEINWPKIYFHSTAKQFRLNQNQFISLSRCSCLHLENMFPLYGFDANRKFNSCSNWRKDIVACIVQVAALYQSCMTHVFGACGCGCSRARFNKIFWKFLIKFMLY